jgi:hypothetical protein
MALTLTHGQGLRYGLDLRSPLVRVGCKRKRREARHDQDLRNDSLRTPISTLETIHYSSFDAAFQAHPVRIADWGYIRCQEADLTPSGVVFFDDVEDPGACRRAAFATEGGGLIVLTIHAASAGDVVLFASDRRIDSASHWRAVVPDAFAHWIEVFDFVYFGEPT